MKKMLMLAIVSFTMFGGAAGASWKWRQMQLATKQSAGDGHEASESTSNEHEESAHAARTPPVTPQAAPSRAHSEPKSRASDGPAARAAMQPTYSPGVEETVQLASSLRDRAASVRERETQLVGRQRQLELVIEDIRSERAAIDDLRTQLDEALKAGEEQMTALQRQRTELEIKQQNINGQVTEMVGQEKDNIKKMGSVYDNMAPESAAKILQQMADSGTMDTAVKLLAVMKERQAAKVLAEMSDPTLAAQLSERLKDLKRPAATIKK